MLVEKLLLRGETHRKGDSAEGSESCETGWLGISQIQDPPLLHSSQPQRQNSCKGLLVNISPVAEWFIATLTDAMVHHARISKHSPVTHGNHPAVVRTIDHRFTKTQQR